MFLLRIRDIKPGYCSCLLLRRRNACCRARFPLFDLDVSYDGPAAQNRSNFAFRYAFRHLGTNSTAKSGLNRAISGKPANRTTVAAASARKGRTPLKVTAGGPSRAAAFRAKTQSPTGGVMSPASGKYDRRSRDHHSITRPARSLIGRPLQTRRQCFFYRRC